MCMHVHKEVGKSWVHEGYVIDFYFFFFSPIPLSVVLITQEAPKISESSFVSDGSCFV